MSKDLEIEKQSSSVPDISPGGTRPRWKDWLAIARIDHWTKHIFMLPGFILAYLIVGVQGQRWSDLLISGVSGLASACLLASANYVLNELCDAEYDRHHPIKKNRPLAAGRLTEKEVLTEYLMIGVSGLGVAVIVSKVFFLTAGIFLIAGAVYNLKPLRFKDGMVLDVLTESVNNPIRLILGWSIVSSVTVPPLSLLILYWFGGAYLMTTKRLAEFRYIARHHDLTELALYRRSFKYYTESSLIVLSLLYSVLSSFFIAVFLVKYRNEYLLALPCFAALFAYYMAIVLRDSSIAQTPEKLHQDKILVGIVVVLSAVLVFCTFVDIPIIQWLVESPLEWIRPDF